MNARIRYTDSLEGITAGMLGGFFQGWASPPSADTHLAILRGSAHVILAVDEDNHRVIGFINAVTDRTHSAFIPLVEVLPAYRKGGTGSELVTRMLATLEDYPCVDLCCDAGLQPFYAKYGMTPSVAMSIRRHGRTAP